MKKSIFMAVLLAAALTALPVFASAAEWTPELPSAEAEVQGEAGEGALEGEESPEGPAPADGPAESAEPSASPEPAPTSEPEPTPEPDPTPEPEAPMVPGLEREEHRVYLRGSGDLVRPDGQLTRGEAACMIYSLLEYEPERNGGAAFSDVSPSAWYGPQVLALAEMGALRGYEDGSFQPGGNITRSEFVAVLSRFFEPIADAPDQFSDVGEDCWARREVNAAGVRGWVNGYSDGSFQPDKHIARAEAVAILNRVLGRTPDKTKLDEDGKVLLFLDLPFQHWAYYELMEAALEHGHLEPATWAWYAVPAAAHKPGYHLSGGELYLVDEYGSWVRNQADGLLYFGDDGRYTTGDALLDRRLSAIVRTYAVEGDGLWENFHRLHLYVASHYGYRAGSYLEDGQTGWEEELALEMTGSGRGNCYRFAALETMLARKMGFQAQGVSGEIDTGNGFVPHGWTEIEADGRGYFCDVEIQYVQPDWDLFMKTYGEVDSRYRVGGIERR